MTPGPFRWFTAACIVSILFGLLHLAAHLGPKPEPRNADDTKLFELMRTVRFDLPGSKRTLQQIDDGFQYFFTLACVTMGAAGLAVGSVRPRPVGAIRRQTLVYIVGFAAITSSSVIHWFVIPISLAGLTLLLFVISLARDGRGAGAATASTS